MKTTVLLTGASGFLGAHLTRELLARRYQVRVLVRHERSTSTLAGLPVEHFVGNVLDTQSLKKVVVGCDVIIHAAALAQVNPARSSVVWAVNHTGTENLIEAAQLANVQRFVYVGTANVFGFGTKQQPGNETYPFVGKRYNSDYIDSKRAATDRVQEAVQQVGLPAIMVHPTFMLGEFDAKPTSGQMLLELYRGRVLGYPAGGKNYVHVRDVAIATVNALTRGRLGESYILGNVNMSYQEAFQLMALRMNVSPPRWSIPPSLAKLYGFGCDALAKLTSHTGKLNSAMIAVANDGHYFSSQKAIIELGLPQTPIEEAIDEAFDWFKRHKYITERA
ncbi:NAD-dependent epimerase/dehydratase family protein [Spirosoma sp. BT702]|uniref:NAD-dependent epimerase/dehydratase family protein n=1 Tax=Spirosoma profusum TaxID=2771354 RepID=A0A927GAV8_9BACT|nr:NAD-dependent epimerase/dehydratase family protein [Spirosoma profusum]MBD2705564.1 NAD-dependent epimerase/dehydratase family protein [Spirosoma profusum]